MGNVDRRLSRLETHIGAGWTLSRILLWHDADGDHSIPTGPLVECLERLPIISNATFEEKTR